jgi:hypothetical protein
MLFPPYFGVGNKCGVQNPDTNLTLTEATIQSVGRVAQSVYRLSYGLGGPGIESRCGRDFPHLSKTGPGAHPASCTMGTGSFVGVEYGRGLLLITHPLLVPWSWKSRAIPLPTLWATPGL